MIISASTTRSICSAVVVAATLALGCGGGGAPGPGGSRISGGVATADTARLERSRQTRLAWLRERIPGLVRSAYADASLDGITVIARLGNNREVSDVTDASGDFELENAPTGNLALILRRGGCEAALPLDEVPSQSTLVVSAIDFVCTADPGTAVPGGIAETFLGVLRDNPENPDADARLCVRVGDDDLTRTVVIGDAPIQNQAGQTINFPALGENDLVEIQGTRPTSGDTNPFVVENVRVLDTNVRDKCETL